MKNTALEFLKTHIFYILGGLCIFVIGLIYTFSRLQPGRQILPQDIIYDSAAVADTLYAQQTDNEPDEDEETEDNRTVTIHIVGEVQNPGVFTLPYGSRIDHALQLAGGGTVYADLSRINLAAVLRDAIQIRIPAFGEDSYDLLIYDEPETPAPTQTAGITEAGLVNVNTASLVELQVLPRIGPAMAQRIIDFREAHGNFASVDELINISGIGEPTLDMLRELVTVGE